jgi:ArsR family transcriptional regulator, arsenate/arsenite/antimonite-responsive transcriptional repressor
MNLGLAFKALNDSTRREILELLKQQDLTAGEIVEKFNISGPSISHHLELLKRAGLVDSKKEGQYVRYSINMTVIDEIMQWMLKLNNKQYEKRQYNFFANIGKFLTCISILVFYRKYARFCSCSF